MTALKLIWEEYWQQIRTGDSRLVFITQTLLIFFLLTLTLTSAAVQHFLDDNLQNMLGSDLVLERYTEMTADQQLQLGEMSDNISETRVFNVTLTHQEQWQQVQLKVVDDAYPVQGQLSIGKSLSGEHLQVSKGPAPGEIWVDSRVFTRLNLSIGQALEVAGSSYQVSAIVFHEPDRIMQGHSVAMRAMVHKDSALGQTSGPTGSASTLSASKIHYRYLINVASPLQRDIQQWVDEYLPDATLISRYDGNHPLGSFWKRVENFIGLSSILLFLMAAIALDLANRRQLIHQQYRLALCMSMGMTLSQGMIHSCGLWLLGFTVSLLPAAGLAYCAEYMLVGELSDTFSGVEFGWYLLPLLKTSGLLVLLLLSFQIPTLITLRQTSVVSLIRKQEQSAFHVGRLFFNLGGLALLALVYSDNGLLTSMVLAALLASAVLMMIVTYVVLIVGEKSSRRYSGLMPFMFFMMRQRLLSKSTQILGIGLCATLLLFTLMLMKDIGASIERQQRTQDGNLIITEAQGEHIAALREWSVATGSEIKQLRPYVQAQLLEVNGLGLTEHTTRPSESSARLTKPVRLSWSEAIPLNNRLTEGEWWSGADGEDFKVSVESEVMADTGLELGDELLFQLAGQTVSLTITAAHEFKGGHGSITFWFQVPPGLMDNVSTDIHVMGSMELPDAAWPELAELWQRFPTLIMLPLKEITERFDRTLNTLTRLVLVFTSMIISMALIVIVASVKGYEADDQKKNGLLLSLGLDQTEVISLSLFEWLVTAVIAATGAILGTWVAGQLIYQSQFSMTYAPSITWLLLTLVTCAVVICTVGLFYCRKSLNVSITQLMAS
jgi:predicted lysophospholipase L1 biosynthesis ABC-type transport system permease subunit